MATRVVIDLLDSEPVERTGEKLAENFLPLSSMRKQRVLQILTSSNQSKKLNFALDVSNLQKQTSMDDNGHSMFVLEIHRTLQNFRSHAISQINQVVDDLYQRCFEVLIGNKQFQASVGSHYSTPQSISTTKHAVQHSQARETNQSLTPSQTPYNSNCSCVKCELQGSTSSHSACFTPNGLEARKNLPNRRKSAPPEAASATAGNERRRTANKEKSCLHEAASPAQSNQPPVHLTPTMPTHSYPSFIKSSRPSFMSLLHRAFQMHIYNPC